MKKIAIFLVIIGLILFLYQSHQQTNDKKQFPALGALIDIDDSMLHMMEFGSGKQTVVLIPGAGDIGLIWDQVIEGLDDVATVVTYDRPGLGFSDSRDISTMDEQVDLLYTGLEGIDKKGPYIVVGHSVGGLIARNFAAKYSKDVSALVLVDSSVEGQFSLLPSEIEKSNKNAGLVFKIANVFARIGVHRIFGMGYAKANSFDLLSQTAKDYIAASLHQSRGFASLEKDQFYAKEIMSTGEPFDRNIIRSIPLTIITRGLAEHEESGASYSEEKQEMFTKTQNIRVDIQSRLGDISDQSSQVIAKKSGHYIHTSEPHVVVEEIKKYIQ